MGEITAFDLSVLKNKYEIKNYVETGTGEAVSLQYALKFGFSKYYTVDIDEDLIHRAIGICAGLADIDFICDLSTNALIKLIPQLSDEPTLFFLDAHFPGADFHKISYEESMRKYMHDSLPLKEEVSIILNNRDISKDVFVIDDLSIYENGQYDSFVWTYQWLQEELGLQTDAIFLYESFMETHNVQKDTRHQGYLLATPK